MTEATPEAKTLGKEPISPREELLSSLSIVRDISKQAMLEKMEGEYLPREKELEAVKLLGRDQALKFFRETSGLRFEVRVLGKEEKADERLIEFAETIGRLAGAVEFLGKRPDHFLYLKRLSTVEIDRPSFVARAEYKDGFKPEEDKIVLDSDRVYHLLDLLFLNQAGLVVNLSEWLSSGKVELEDGQKVSLTDLLKKGSQLDSSRVNGITIFEPSSALVDQAKRKIAPGVVQEKDRREAREDLARRQVLFEEVSSELTKEAEGLNGLTWSSSLVKELYLESFEGRKEIKSEARTEEEERMLKDKWGLEPLLKWVRKVEGEGKKEQWEKVRVYPLPPINVPETIKIIEENPGYKARFELGLREMPDRLMSFLQTLEIGTDDLGKEILFQKVVNAFYWDAMARAILGGVEEGGEDPNYWRLYWNGVQVAAHVLATELGMVGAEMDVKKFENFKVPVGTDSGVRQVFFKRLPQVFLAGEEVSGLVIGHAVRKAQELLPAMYPHSSKTSKAE